MRVARPRAPCSRSVAAGCSWRPPAGRSAAAATATLSSTTWASPAGMRRSAPEEMAGRSRTSVPPTACSSTVARTRGPQPLHLGRPRRARLDRDHLRTWMTTLEPVSVALKFGFIAVLYLFLLWVARSARKDLRGGGARFAASAARTVRRSHLTPLASIRRPRWAAPAPPSWPPGWWWSAPPATTRE